MKCIEKHCRLPQLWKKKSKDCIGRLAQEVRALFQLPRHMHELDPKEAPFHVPLAPPSLHRQRFMPPVVSAFACWDIQEISREKMVAYAQALQCLTEWNNPPKKDQPCLLVESMAELRREVGFYLSFTDEEVFQGVDLPKEEGSKPSAPTITTADAPGATTTIEMPSIQKAAPDYAGWDRVVHPSRPVVATGEIPQPTITLQMKSRVPPFTRTTSISPPSNPPSFHLHQSLLCQLKHWH